MKTKNLVLMALLVGIGTALYLVMPPVPIGGGIKPDLMLTMMFVGIILFPTVRDTFILSVVTGVLSGLFSSIPGSLIPNIIDKFATGFIFFVVVLLVNKFAKNVVAYGILIGLGTLLSGTVFLSMLLLLVGEMPANFWHYVCNGSNSCNDCKYHCICNYLSYFKRFVNAFQIRNFCYTSIIILDISLSKFYLDSFFIFFHFGLIWISTRINILDNFFTY